MQPETLITVPELFRQSFQIYRRKWWTLLVISLVNLIPLAIALVLSVPAALFFAFHYWSRWLFITTFAGGIVIAVIIGSIVAIWATVAMVQCVRDDRPLSGMQYLRQSGTLLSSALWVSGLVGLAVLGGSVLFIVPGILFIVWFSFAYYALVADGKRGAGAMQTSKRLVDGYGWPVFGRLLLVWLIFLAVNVVFHWLGGLVDTLLVSPFFLCYLSVLYDDLKRIKRSAV